MDISKLIRALKVLRPYAVTEELDELLISILMAENTVISQEDTEILFELGVYFQNDGDGVYAIIGENT